MVTTWERQLFRQTRTYRRSVSFLTKRPSNVKYFFFSGRSKKRKFRHSSCDGATSERGLTDTRMIRERHWNDIGTTLELLRSDAGTITSRGQAPSTGPSIFTAHRQFQTISVDGHKQLPKANYFALFAKTQADNVPTSKCALRIFPCSPFSIASSNCLNL